MATTELHIKMNRHKFALVDLIDFSRNIRGSDNKNSCSGQYGLENDIRSKSHI